MKKKFKKKLSHLKISPAIQRRACKNGIKFNHLAKMFQSEEESKIAQEKFASNSNGELISIKDFETRNELETMSIQFKKN